MTNNSIEFKTVKFTDATPLPEHLLSLKKLLIDAFKAMQSRCNDAGFKGGIKTTSYKFTEGNTTINHWHGDAELCYTLLVNDQKQFTFYDCWGRGHVEFIDESSLASVEACLNMLLSGTDITLDV